MNKAGEPVKQFCPYQVDSDIRPIYQDVLAPGNGRVPLPVSGVQEDSPAC